MANPIFDMMKNQQFNNNTNQLSQIYKMFSSGNPTAIFSQIAQKNPQLQPVLQLLNKGVNPEQIARQMMAERGINPETFLKQIIG